MRTAGARRPDNRYYENLESVEVPVPEDPEAWEAVLQAQQACDAISESCPASARKGSPHWSKPGSDSETPAMRPRSQKRRSGPERVAPISA